MRGTSLFSLSTHVLSVLTLNNSCSLLSSSSSYKHATTATDVISRKWEGVEECCVDEALDGWIVSVFLMYQSSCLVILTKF